MGERDEVTRNDAEIGSNGPAFTPDNVQTTAGHAALRGLNYGAQLAAVQMRPGGPPTNEVPLAAEKATSAEGMEFAAELAADSVQLPPRAKPERFYQTARQQYLRLDPRFHELAGIALKIDGRFPTPHFIAKICAYQQSINAVVSGTLEPEHFTTLVKTEARDYVAKNRDILGGSLTPRDYKPGAKAAVPQFRSKYNERSDPVFGMGWYQGAGVNNVLFAKLKAAEARLVPIMAQDIANHGNAPHPERGAPLSAAAPDLRHWLGIRQPHLGFRRGERQGYHKTGSALDINAHTNPWAAVRTGRKKGGEAVYANLPKVADAALDVMDRATLWCRGHRARVHAAPRPVSSDTTKLEEWAAEVWKNFEDVSASLAEYFALGFDVDRGTALGSLTDDVRALQAQDPNAPHPNVLPFATLLQTLPRRADADAAERISASLSKGRPWTTDPARVIQRMPTDVRAIAKIMVRGNASDAPTNVRNPTNGIMDLKKELVQALVGVGLFWGGCDFGASESGDLMHFDLGRVPDFGHGESDVEQTETPQ